MIINVWEGSSNGRSLLTTPDIAQEGATPQEKWNDDMNGTNEKTRPL
jgi:hypothetical protein